MLSPAQKFVFAAMLGVLAHALVIWAVVVQPWIGVGLAGNSDGAGWVVIVVPEGSHAYGKIEVGDVILSVVGKDGSIVEATPDLLIQDLIDFSSTAQWLAFMQNSERLNNFLQQGEVTVALASGERAAWEVSKIGFAQLNFNLWLSLLMSLAAWLMVSFIWIFAERSLASYFLLLLGLGFVGIVCGQAVAVITFSSVTDGWSVLNYFGSGLFSGALLSLLMVYPSPLVKNNFVYLPLVALPPLMLLVPYLAINPYIFLSIFSWALLLALVVLVILQWRRSSEHPVRRAMFRWFFGVILLSIFLTIILMMVGVSIVFNMVPLCLMFLGFVFGVRRYRLFDVERWWFAMWAWVVGGLAVVGMDVLLVWGAGLGQSISITLSLVIVGWVYFPLRQKLWSRWVGGATQTTEHYLPEVIASIFGEDQQPLQQRWQGMMRRIFQPLTLERAESMVQQVELAADGTALLLPGVAGEPGLRLGCPQQGKRLYSRQDAQLAQSLIDLGRRALQLRVSHEQGAEAERQRIVRDLHDDVGAELVTLMHCLQNSEHAERVAQVTRNLRGVVCGLSHCAMPLFEAAGEWRAEVEERCRLAGVVLHWRVDDVPDDLILTPRQFINLTRILREAVTNALRHAHPSNLNVKISVQSGKLELAVSDDGHGMDGQRKEGHGRHNMRMRAEELGGSLAWSVAEGEGCRVTANIPLPGWNDEMEGNV